LSWNLASHIPLRSGYTLRRVSGHFAIQSRTLPSYILEALHPREVAGAIVVPRDVRIDPRGPDNLHWFTPGAGGVVSREEKVASAKIAHIGISVLWKMAAPGKYSKLDVAR
jgi:hypothetical protein